MIAVVTLLISACGGDDDDPGASGTTTTPASSATIHADATSEQSLSGSLTIFAAASLTDVFREIETLLEDRYPDLSIEQNFGGSQQLVTQMTEGANADVFASANIAQMDAARAAGVVTGDSVIIARNRLVIVAPSDNPRGIEQPEDLATDGLKLVIANDSVPVGQYTLEMLDKLSAEPSHGADFRARVDNNIVSFEENVRQVVAKVQLGEVDAGIAYLTDATAAGDDVVTIEIPEAFTVIADYPIASAAGGNTDLAQAFIAFLLSAEGQSILTRHGFVSVE
jgi:molybdate transport system substrate-binding protein